MKLIIAYIDPQKWDGIKEKLYKAKINKISVIEASGYQNETLMVKYFLNRVEEQKEDVSTRLRIEIAVNDNDVLPAINAVVSEARTGEKDDGKIFILNLEDCIRVRSGESGCKAIG